MTGLSDQRHAETFERLRARGAQLAERVARLQSDRRRSQGALDPDFAEQAVERENDEVLDALDQVERQELSKTRAALRRIDAGCFGICDECGGDIDPLRLDADPSVECCTRCAASREAR